jgi:hypothetical protein
MKQSAGELTESQALGVQIGGIASPLFWVDGILLRFSVIAQTETIVKELLKGNVHWDGVSFALMPDYKRQVVLENNISIPIINVSENKGFKEVAKFLKTVNLE